MLCLFFFLMDTATTEIYTDLPTLALHDALPIFPIVAEGEIGAETDTRGRRHLQGHGRIGSRQPAGRAGREIAETQFTDDTRRDQRSEEHTSELQSLMRISYAVFCLKKKK